MRCPKPAVCDGRVSLDSAGERDFLALRIEHLEDEERSASSVSDEITPSFMAW